MKTAFALLLVALMILPAVVTVRLRLNRVRREMEAQKRLAIAGEEEARAQEAHER